MHKGGPMVEKPTEGICGACDSEELEFFDDGSGRCISCDRVFRWDSEDTNDDKILSKRAGRKSAFNPARRPAAARSEKEKYTGFIKILIVGFLLLIAGFSLMFSMHAMEDFVEEPIEFTSTLVIFSLFFVNIGIVIIGLGLVMGAVKAEHMDEEIRAWMLMAMAVLLGVFLGLGNFLLIVNLL